MKNKRLFTYVFLFGLLVNGSACGSDHNETDFPETPGGETPSSPSGLQAYMLTTTDTRTYDLRESTVEFEPQASMSPKNILLNPQQIYQTMQGFGAALTGSSAFCLKLMKQEARPQFGAEAAAERERRGAQAQPGDTRELLSRGSVPRVGLWAEEILRAPSQGGSQAGGRPGRRAGAGDTRELSPQGG